MDMERGGGDEDKETSKKLLFQIEQVLKALFIRSPIMVSLVWTVFRCCVINTDY